MDQTLWFSHHFCLPSLHSGFSSVKCSPRMYWLTWCLPGHVSRASAVCLLSPWLLCARTQPPGRGKMGRCNTPSHGGSTAKTTTPSPPDRCRTQVRQATCKQPLPPVGPQRFLEKGHCCLMRPPFLNGKQLGGGFCP